LFYYVETISVRDDIFVSLFNIKIVLGVL
jgi:hypothetical protein